MLYICLNDFKNSFQMIKGEWRFPEEKLHANHSGLVSDKFNSWGVGRYSI